RLWGEVGSSSTQYPEGRGQVLLDFRARAGQVAYLRYRPGVITEGVAAGRGEDGHDPSWAALTRLPPTQRLEIIIESLPSLQTLLDDLGCENTVAWQRQAIHTEMGLLDDAVEALEQADWSSPPQDLAARLIERATSLARQLRSVPWIELYVQRLVAISSGQDQSWNWRDCWQAEV